MRKGRLLVQVAGCLAAGAACSSEPPSGPYASASVTVQSDTLEVSRGGSANLLFSVHRVNGHALDVNFGFDPAPIGITAIFFPPKVTSKTTATSGAVAVAASTPLGYYTLVARAWGDWLDADSRLFKIVIRVVEPGIDITGNTASLTTEQAIATSMIITLERSGGFTGTVSLTTPDLPPGVTASFSPELLVGSNKTSTVTFLPTLAAEPRDYQVHVRATGNGIPVSDVLVGLKVLPTTTRSIALRTNTQSLTLPASATVQVSITIMRFAGYDGPVSLSVEGVPQFVAATLAPTPTLGNTATLSLTAGGDVVNGGHYITVRATAPGAAPASAIILVQLAQAN